MRTTFLLLVSLFSFTVICPITMGAMPMDMGNVQGMFYMTQSGHSEDTNMFKHYEEGIKRTET